MRRFDVSIILATILFCASVEAQTAKTPTEEEYWENTSIKVGFNTWHGDTDATSLIIHADWNACVGLMESDLDFDSSFHIARRTDFIDQQKLDWALRRSFRPHSKWFAMVHSWVEHNDSTGIDLRTAIGPGIGIHLIDNKKTRVTLEGGVAFTAEKEADGVDQDYTAIFFDPSWNWVINDRAKIDHDTKFRLNADDTDDLRIYSETDLTYQITKTVLALAVGVVINYDARPVRNHKDLNYETHTMLKITFSGKSK